MQMNPVIVSLTAAQKGDRGPGRREVRRKERQGATAEDGMGERMWKIPSKEDGKVWGKVSFLKLINLAVPGLSCCMGNLCCGM